MEPTEMRTLFKTLKFSELPLQKKKGRSFSPSSGSPAPAQN